MAEKADRKIVYVPSVRAGRGSGHFHRAMEFVSLYGPSSPIYIHNVQNQIDYLGLIENSKLAENMIHTETAVFKDADLVICDMFKTDKKLFATLTELAGTAPLLGIDEGGPMRAAFSFLLDTLPNLENVRPNICDPAFVNPGQTSPAAQKNESILVCFGGEDPAGLSEKFIESIRKWQCTEQFTLIIAGDNTRKRLQENIPENIRLTGPVQNLSAFMSGFRGCICSFGLTAMEAAFASLPCLLFNPGRYHIRIAEKAGFDCPPHPGPDRQYLKDFLIQPERFINKTIISGKAKTLAEFIRSSEWKGYPVCPVCSSTNVRTICRTKTRRYSRCRKCGIIYMFSLGEKAEEYREAYFDEEYRKQYGRTYLEDFNKIKAMGVIRLDYICKYLNSAKKRLLDIGCAYGPFLQAASEAGFQVAGCDISPEAVRYVKEELGIEVWEYDGKSSLIGQHPKDVITLWYVIEHLENLKEFLNEVSKRLVKGGVLAFSTPNYRGISGRKSLKRFLTGGPKDHYTVWSPRTAHRILRKAGFKLCKIRITGHHPERFPFFGKFAQGAGYTILEKISKIAKLGDTFEVYARKR